MQIFDLCDDILEIIAVKTAQARLKRERAAILIQSAWRERQYQDMEDEMLAEFESQFEC
jgi:hypothetical protein